MTKTNKRRRVASVLLALVMLLSLMPGLELPAHAFWEDYDQGTDCIYCDHYHWGENMCDGCGFCTVDCNSDCFAEFHCNDCGECLFNTPYWCDQCYKCADCMEETHCSTCGKCYIGEDDQLCGECHKGPCCSITICDTCGFCDDCANDDSDPMHCSLCNACFGSVDECVDDDDTGVIHCIDCHTACEQCEEACWPRSPARSAACARSAAGTTPMPAAARTARPAWKAPSGTSTSARAAAAGSRIRRTRTSSAKPASCAKSAAKATPTAPRGCA